MSANGGARSTAVPARASTAESLRMSASRSAVSRLPTTTKGRSRRIRQKLLSRHGLHIRGQREDRDLEEVGLFLENPSFSLKFQLRSDEP